MKKTTILLAACLPFFLAGCAEMETKPAAAVAASPELDQTIANAEKEIAAAKKVNHLWRDTEKFLEDAKKDKAAGKLDDAMKNAKKALKEAIDAQKQAAAEAASAKVNFPK